MDKIHKLVHQHCKECMGKLHVHQLNFHFNIQYDFECGATEPLCVVKALECTHKLYLPGANSIKKYMCTLQVGPLFLQIHTNLNPLKVFTSSL